MSYLINLFTLFMLLNYITACNSNKKATSNKTEDATNAEKLIDSSNMFIDSAIIIIDSSSNITPDDSNNNTTDEDTNDEQNDTANVEIVSDTIITTLTDTFSVELHAHFSTGKMWLVSHCDSSIVLINKYETRDAIKEKKTDVQHFVFITNKTGIFNMQFSYQRPFGKNKRLSKIINQKIIVK